MRSCRLVIYAAITLVVAFSAYSQTPRAIETELLGDLDNISKFGNYGGSYDEDKSNKYNKLLKARLVKYGGRTDVLKYSFAGLKDKMYVATAKDGRFRIYSWDSEAGGTMHDFDSVYQFQGRSGKVLTWIEPLTEEDGGGGYYRQIFEVASKDGPIYLANSAFIAQGTIHGQSIEAMRIIGDQLERKAKVFRTASGLKSSIDFSYDPFTLEERSEQLVFFDPAKQEFRFPVVVQDKGALNGRVTRRFITYRFNGTYFVKVG